MSIEILLLAILVGITILGYMIAINSQGPTKLSISYLLATILLAGTVWAIVQHVNANLDKVQQEEYKKLELAKKQAELMAKTKEESLEESKKKMEAVAKFNTIISKGTNYAATMENVDLRDFSVDLDVLISRASAMKGNVKKLESEFNKLSEERALLPVCANYIEKAISNLTEAAKYYYLYFRSEDTSQEETRENIMRSRAREASVLFQKAAKEIVSSR